MVILDTYRRFIPAAIGYSKNAPVYRYMAIREVMGSMELPGMESPQLSFPFPTLHVNSQRYKLFGLVTNMDWAGEQLIHWHRERYRGAQPDQGTCSGSFWIIMHNHMTQKDNDHLGGGFSEHIFTKRVKLAHCTHRKLLE